MTSPYGPFGSNDPQPWGQPPGGSPGPASGDGAAAPVPRWGPVPAPQWGPAPVPQWGPASQSRPVQDPGQSDRRPRWRVPTVRRALLVTGPVLGLVALVVVLGLVWPGFLNKKVFDGAALQVGVTDVLRNSYQVEVGAVNCPAGQPVRVGTRFPCVVLVDGEQRTVTIVVTSDDGRFEVGRPQ
ncbi:uncharacterized protein DUF4333 [Micromonospora pisi]|uniref:Uncharacterized protein DUF4333 n=1 Tax=Micromonospora pisi TaxID=589240 RepID=A0A495JE23_9ACTN|nr:DUF4333 domain-containing protein [Micromonospora pisi]RKR86319.1 uncharacterized protein DUF4333 [Micromonospora pisi]